MLKTQAAWDVVEDSNEMQSDRGFATGDSSSTHSGMLLKSALKMNELLSCTSKCQSLNRKEIRETSKTNSDSKMA